MRICLVMARTKSIKDERIIEALMSEPNVTAAAKACGCSRSTIYSRLNNPFFSAKLSAVINERRNAINALAAQSCQIATEKILELLTAPGVSDAVRLRAATAALKIFWQKTDQVSTQSDVGVLDWL